MTDDCLRSFTQIDNLTIDFPPVAEEVDRTLLLAALFFLEFRYFDLTPGK